MEQIGDGWSPPSEVRDRVNFHWFHVVPGTSLVVMFLSLRPVWFVGHFSQGRMLRCTGDGCRRCEMGIGRQIRYIISAVELGTKRIGVIEISESVSRLIQQWAAANEGARGLIVEMRKATRSKHSRMEVSLVHERAPAWAMALEGLDLREVLLRTWDRVEQELGAELVRSGG